MGELPHARCGERGRPPTERRRPRLLGLVTPQQLPTICGRRQRAREAWPAAQRRGGSRAAAGHLDELRVGADAGGDELVVALEVGGAHHAADLEHVVEGVEELDVRHLLGHEPVDHGRVVLRVVAVAEALGVNRGRLVAVEQLALHLVEGLHHDGVAVVGEARPDHLQQLVEVDGAAVVLVQLDEDRVDVRLAYTQLEVAQRGVGLCAQRAEGEARVDTEGEARAGDEGEVDAGGRGRTRGAESEAAHRRGRARRSRRGRTAGAASSG